LKFAVIYPFLHVLSEQQISPLGEDHLTLSVFFPCEWLDEYLFFEFDWLFFFFQPHQFKLPDLFLKLGGSSMPFPINGRYIKLVK
jgi:hypothetical protein